MPYIDHALLLTRSKCPQDFLLEAQLQDINYSFDPLCIDGHVFMNFHSYILGLSIASQPYYLYWIMLPRSCLFKLFNPFFTTLYIIHMFFLHSLALYILEIHTDNIGACFDICNSTSGYSLFLRAILVYNFSNFQ